MTLTYITDIRNALIASAQSNTTNNHNNFSKHKSFRSRIKQVATVSLIFLSMVTGEVFAGDKRPKSKAKPSRKQEVTFETMHFSNNLPDVVPTLPLPEKWDLADKLPEGMTIANVKEVIENALLMSSYS